MPDRPGQFPRKLSWRWWTVVFLLVLFEASGLTLLAKRFIEHESVPDSMADFAPFELNDKTYPQNTPSTQTTKQTPSEDWALEPIARAKPVEPTPISADERRLPQPRIDEEPAQGPLNFQELPVRQGQSSKRSKKYAKWKPAALVVVTNFGKADVLVNGRQYPELFDSDDEGMLLPAGGPHVVEVTFDGNSKTYEVFLKPYETRLLVVELNGDAGSGARTAAPIQSNARKNEEKEEEAGQLKIYSKPRGSVIIDGKDTGKQTPESIDMSDGRHEVQVKYEGGEISEKKVVRVRKGSRIKLFFREKK